MKKIILAMIACVRAPWRRPASAQQTTGNIQGRIVDAQKAAVPGVTVTAKSAETGFIRTDVSDAEGIYRLTALPVGSYDVHAELSGFTTYDRKEVDGQRRADDRPQHRAEGRRRVGERERHRRDAARSRRTARRSAASSTRPRSRACRSTAVSSRTSR